MECQSCVGGCKCKQEPIDSDYIISVVSQYYGVSIEKMLSDSRYYKETLSRQIAMYFVRNHGKLTLEQIGEVFNRHYSTVIYSLKMIDNYLSYDKKIQKDLEELLKLIENKLE